MVMKKRLLVVLLLISVLSFSQEKKIYRIYLKDNTTMDVINPVKVLNNVNYLTLEGTSGTIENSKYYSIRAVTNSQENYVPTKYKYCELVGYDNRKIFDFKEKKKKFLHKKE